MLSAAWSRISAPDDCSICLLKTVPCLLMTKLTVTSPWMRRRCARLGYRFAAVRWLTRLARYASRSCALIDASGLTGEAGAGGAGIAGAGAEVTAGVGDGGRVTGGGGGGGWGGAGTGTSVGLGVGFGFGLGTTCGSRSFTGSTAAIGSTFVGTTFGGGAFGTSATGAGSGSAGGVGRGSGAGCGGKSKSDGRSVITT